MDCAEKGTKKSRCCALVLAGGSGKRMGLDIPKQYLMLDDHTVLWHSLDAFERSPLVDEIIVVCPPSDQARCQEAIFRENSKVTAFAPARKERYDSVYNGLLACPGADLVLIHDGARPFVDEKIIERCVEAARREGACAAGMPSKDTVKLTDKDGWVESTPDRRQVWIVQTPQAFSYSLILGCHERLRRGGLMEGVTDDAMMVEREGAARVRMVEGSYRNIKITTLEDLSIAQALLKGTVER